MKYAEYVERAESMGFLPEITGIEFDYDTPGGGEISTILNLLGRMGYEVTSDSNGFITANRCPLVLKPEFKAAVGRVDTEYFGGFAWSRLARLGMDAERELTDAPVRFINTGYNGLSKGLVAETLGPTIEWATEHMDGRNVNERTIEAWKVVDDLVAK